jgi:hypothetical protein
MVAPAPLQTPRNGSARRRAGYRYAGQFNKLKKREQGYRRLALALAMVLAGMLTVLLLEVFGYVKL